MMILPPTPPQTPTTSYDTERALREVQHRHALRRRRRTRWRHWRRKLLPWL